MKYSVGLGSTKKANNLIDIEKDQSFNENNCVHQNEKKIFVTF